MIYIGIDTGGTCTDAVVYDGDTRQVLAKNKALTTKDDLARGINAVLDGLPDDIVKRAVRVSISTTLATNACVEGKGGRAKLVILGTTDEVLRHIDADKLFGFSYEDTLPLDDHNTYDGRVAEDPDWDAVVEEHPAFFDDAQAFGVAEAFSMRNGGVVEEHAASYLEERFGVPVIQACSLVHGLNVMERGATALLNARLMPLSQHFIEAVGRALLSRGITAPVMIVRSDGSLMVDELAMSRPVETILSGPAASVSGARGLAAEDDCLIVDMGGTTTDIALTSGGRPVMTDGIRIGGWATQIEGVSIDTIGLGGDSAVHIVDGRLELSPRRVEPLCMTAKRFPQIKNVLARLVANGRTSSKPLHEFLYLVRQPIERAHYTAGELELVDLLAECGGPVSLCDRRVDIYTLDTERLEREGIVMRCGITPTDAMHVKGDYSEYDAEASRLAICYLMGNLTSYARLGADAGTEALADAIYELVECKLFSQIVQVLAAHCYPKECAGGLGEKFEQVMRASWQNRTARSGQMFSFGFDAHIALVGVGAPTHVFLDEVARALGTHAVIARDAEVANAIGAILADITADARVDIVPDCGADGVASGFRVHGIGVNELCETIDEARDHACAAAKRLAVEEARRRGAIGALDVALDENVRMGTSKTGTQVELSRAFIATARTKMLA